MITKCPDCGKIFDVELSWKGQEATCDSCEKSFIINKLIECPQCSQLTPENADKCGACNFPLFIPLKRTAQFIPDSNIPKSQSANQYSDEKTLKSNSTDSISKEYLQTINYDEDKIVLESVPWLMRFWIGLCTVLTIVTGAIAATVHVIGIIATAPSTEDTIYLVWFSLGFFLDCFVVIIVAPRMLDSVVAKAKFYYNTFDKIIFVAYLFFCIFGMIVIGNSLLAETEPMVIKTAIVLLHLFYVYTVFTAWQLYKARALAQAETIIDEE